MKLGVVGHAAEKFTERTADDARAQIRAQIVARMPDVIVSGRSPMGGVDIWAEEIAAAMGIATEIYPPKVHNWSAPGGFKDRNLQIARASDHVLCVVVAHLPPGFTGMKFARCYHCNGRTPEHVKSGGCWTAWQCRSQSWAVIP